MLSVLQLTDRADSLTTERMAKKIIECAQAGERDPIRLRNYAIKSLRQPQVGSLFATWLRGRCSERRGGSLPKSPSCQGCLAIS